MECPNIHDFYCAIIQNKGLTAVILTAQTDTYINLQKQPNQKDSVHFGDYTATGFAQPALPGRIGVCFKPTVRICF